MVLEHRSEASAFSESFGDDFVEDCGAQWFDDCEDGWSGHGASDHLALAFDSAETTNFGVAIVGSSSSEPNGVSVSLAPASGHEVGTWEVKTYAISGGGSVVARVVFRDSNGDEISSAMAGKNASTGKEYVVTIEATLPPGTSTVDLMVGAGEPASTPGGCRFLCATVCNKNAQITITTPSGFL